MALYRRFFGSTIGNAASYAMGAATADTLHPVLQELVNAAWQAHPARPLNAEQAAELLVRGVWDDGQATGEGNRTGVSDSRLRDLSQTLYRRPGLAELLDMWRRGIVGRDLVENALRRQGFSAAWVANLVQLRDVPLTPEQAGAAVERGEMSYEDAQGEAAMSGTSAERFRVIERLAGLAPAPDQLADMRRRGLIDDARYRRGLVQGNVRSEWADALRGLAEHLLSTGELANMVVQGVIAAETGADLAALTGVSAENFARLVRLAGNPIGSHEALDLWNRGDIDEADVDRALRQSHLKPEWIDPFKRLKRRQLSVSDLVRIVVHEGYADNGRPLPDLRADMPPEFVREVAKQGITPEDAERLWAAHWRLPSPTQGYAMLHRGEIDEAELASLLKQADYSPRWRDRLRRIAFHPLGRIDIRRALSTGDMTPAEAHRRYEHLGYTPEDAALMVRIARTTEPSATKDLSAAQLATEYEGRFIDRAEYLRRLEVLGYSEAEAGQLADLADARRVQRAREQVISRVHAQYVGHKISLATAEAMLSKRGIPDAARAQITEAWQDEQAVNVRVLTPPQVRKAYTKSLITREQAIDTLTDQGYSEANAVTLLDSA